MSRRISPFALLLIANCAFAAPIDDAIRLLSEGRPEAAARILYPLADAGSAEAQYRLGTMYFSGTGVEENERKSYELLLKSAQQGHVPAMMQLGNVLTFGQQISNLISDPDQEAAKWYFQAASAGNAEAQYSLGVLFQTGKGVVRDEKESMYWMQQAAKSGHESAKAYVGAVKRR